MDNNTANILNENIVEETGIIELLRKAVATLTKKRPVSLEDTDRDTAFKAVTLVYEQLGGEFENEGDWDWEFADNDLEKKVLNACAKVNKKIAKEGSWWN